MMTIFLTTLCAVPIIILYGMLVWQYVPTPTQDAIKPFFIRLWDLLNAKP